MDILLSLKNMIAPQVSGPMSLSQFEDYDVQCPAFFRTTDEERDRLLDHVRQNPYVEKADVTGRGFLSVRLKSDVFGAIDFTAETQDPKTYVVDYGGMNVAKRLHIGHIRSMFIGDSICRLLKNQGHKVIPQNHLGDWGNQFGPLLEQMLEKHPDLTLWTGDLLTEAYRESVLRAKEDPEFSERANNRAVLLQQKTDGLTIKAWEQAVSLSMEENNEWFTRFGLLLTQEDTAGESSYADRVQGVISGLVEKGLAEENADGSVVAIFE